VSGEWVQEAMALLVGRINSEVQIMSGICSENIVHFFRKYFQFMTKSKFLILEPKFLKKNGGKSD
jgi:hypothetical protein